MAPKTDRKEHSPHKRTTIAVIYANIVSLRAIQAKTNLLQNSIKGIIKQY
jgi:hypothetical protein